MLGYFAFCRRHGGKADIIATSQFQDPWFYHELGLQWSSVELQWSGYLCGVSVHVLYIVVWIYSVLSSFLPWEYMDWLL